MLKKFDAIDYLVKKYVDDGEHATIPVWLDKKEDFFNKFDPTDTAISPDVSEYLDMCSDNIPLIYKIRIDIVCNDLNEETKEKIKAAVKNHYGLKAFDIDLDLKANFRRSLFLGIVGLFLVMFIYLGGNVNFVNTLPEASLLVIKEILTITGWVFMWSAIEKIFFNTRKLKDKKMDYTQMFNAIFLFENENEYYKILKQEETEEIKENEKYEEIRDSFLDQ